MATSRITKTIVQPVIVVDQDNSDLIITKAFLETANTIDQDNNDLRITKAIILPASTIDHDNNDLIVTKTFVQVMSRYVEGIYKFMEINNTAVNITDRTWDGQVPVSDPYYSYVTMLLHANGTNGSTTFIDEKSNTTFSLSSTAQLTTAEKKFGTASFYFNNNITYEFNCTNSGLNVGGDFTFEFWYYRLNSSGGTLYGHVSDSMPQWNASEGLVRVAPGKNIAIDVGSNNVWHHYALSRVGSTIRAFVDGVEQGSSVTESSTINFSPLGFSKFYPNSNEPWWGYIDEVRFTNGVGRYTSNFTVSPFPFPNM